MVGEGGAIAFVAEAPGDAAVIQFELRASFLRTPVGEIRDRIETIDREPGIAVDYDLFGGGGAYRARVPKPGGEGGKQDRGPQSARVRTGVDGAVWS